MGQRHRADAYLPAGATVRLPWLQVDQDGINRCRLLSRLLGIPETQGIGIAMSLWQWALEIANDGDFRGVVPGTGANPALLAAATGWPINDGARLVVELQRVGFVATTPELRVRGLDRYRRAWEKNRRRGGKSAYSGGAVPGTGANPARTRPEPARQTQTQTQNRNNTVEDEPRLLVVQEQPTGDEADVWECWKDVCSHPKAVLTADRRKLIRKWLPIYGVQRLQDAIIGCSKSPHHQGQNDRHCKYDSLELILRDAKHIEDFEALAPRRGTA